MVNGFIRVAAVVPALKVADINFNTKEIIRLAKEADKSGTGLVVFPELCLTGYTLGDLFHQRLVLEEALAGLGAIKKASKEIKSVLAVGLPMSVNGRLFNVAAIVYGGKIYGIVPKTFIPNYKEFYEERWFSSARDLDQKEIDLFSASVPIGTDILFRFPALKGAVLGVEICEDVWVPVPPSSYQVLAGATIVANLSASNDLVGKAEYRRSLVAQQSGRGICGYVYTSCGVHESTTDLVFGGHAMIAENGGVIAEAERFKREGGMIISEIDIEHLLYDRERTTSFGEGTHGFPKKDFRFIDVPIKVRAIEKLFRRVDSHPFVPQNVAERDKRAEEIFSIQTAGLANRLEQPNFKKMVIGVSGGLDSTLALLVAARTADLLKIPRRNIYAFTMPGFGTTKRTKSNAVKLAEALGVTLETISITEGSLQQFKDISHDKNKKDITYQNVQARYRTMILMNKANQLGGIVVGTGDLSEIALGWSTFTGDHISHYNVNASVPKTLVKYLVQWVSEQKEFNHAQKILKDILDTPISPELIRDHKHAITQKTEDLIGPYELHDFYLYHFVRWGSDPKRILWLANIAFAGKYKLEVIKKWLTLFIRRFFNNQWKRSVMPDGPKVGSVSLSPRGDWRMPSDAEVALWLRQLR